MPTLEDDIALLATLRNMSITDRIRRQLDQPDGLVAESLAPLAEEYGRESSQVNARLVECIALLRKGLRSEAIQRATMKPDILDWSARLDFPELEDWLAILQFYGIPAPHLLDRDAALQIQEAMIEVQPLEQLLRQHRRLAIAKAPLAWRLKVLRSLAKTDPTNLVWREDQEQWERARLKQIPQELKAATDSRDVERVNRIVADLNDPQWIAERPSDLCKRASEAADGFIHEDQLVELRQIAERLHAAYGEGDESAAKAQRGAWDKLRKAMKQGVPDELSEEVAPAFQWLDDRAAERKSAKRHEDATNALANCLRQKVSLEDLDQAYHRVLSLRQGIDPSLEQRVIDRITALEQSAISRKRTIRLLAVLSVIAILTAVGLWQWNRSFQMAVNDSVHRLTEMIDSKSLDSADALLAKLQKDAPQIVASSKMTDVVAKLQAARNQDNQRAARVQQLIAAAKHDDPTQIDIGKIVTAELEAVTPQEKEDIAAIRSVWETQDQKVTDQQLVIVKDHLKAVDDKLIALRGKKPDTIALEELNALISGIEKIESENPKGASKLTLSITSNIQKIKALIAAGEQSREQSRKRLAAMEAVRASGDLDDYIEAIKSFVKNVPSEDAITKSMRDVLEEEELWGNVTEWNKFCNDLELALGNGLDAAEVKQLAESSKSLRSKFPKIPGMESLAPLHQIVDSMEVRAQEANSIKEELKNSIVGELVTVVEMRGAEGINGKRRFMNYDTRMQYAEEIGALKESSNTSLPVIGDASGAVTQHRFRGKVTVLDEPRNAIKKIVQRFETKQADVIADWDAQLNATLKELIDNDRLDAMIKELLLARLAKAASAGSPAMQQAYLSLNQSLIDGGSDRELWFLEKSFTSDLNSDLAQMFEDAATALQKSHDEVPTELSKLAKRRLLWLGAVLPGETGQLEYWTPRKNIPDGYALVLQPINESGTQFQLLSIGQFREGTIEVKIEPTLQKTGRPFFWLSSEK